MQKHWTSKGQLTERENKYIRDNKLKICGECAEISREIKWAGSYAHDDRVKACNFIRKKIADLIAENKNIFGYDRNKIFSDEEIADKIKQSAHYLFNTAIENGKIRYDGININKIKKSDLRKSLGIVLQDTHLFTGTVMENIRYGKLDATDEEVYAAAKLANADSFITKLSDGYNTMLTGDGANLSQGQRQLLAIARAAIADPPVLILDEATSSIDTRTEKMVQDGMDKLMHGRTTFVIAHRLSTVKNSDCIMVLEQGRIIERGTHDDLIEQKGRYYQLYTGNNIAG